MKIVLDLEANGLLDSVDTIWHIVCKPLGEDRYIVFSDYYDDVPDGAVSDFPAWADENVTAIIAHNGIRYDLEVLYRLLGWEPNENIKIYDTLIMSRVNNFIRPATGRRHSLKAWGDFLGFPKIDYTGGFDEWHPDMLPYCKVDCDVTEKVWEHVLKEFKSIANKNPSYMSGMRLEHDLSRLSAQMTRDGWMFDFPAAQKLIDKITEEMREIEEAVEPHLKDIIRVKDDPPKTAKYKQDGTYNANTCRILSEFLGYTVSPEDALKANPPIEPNVEFVRTETVKASMGNQDVVKEYLYELGWKPLEWNWRNVNGQWIKLSPKFCEKSIAAIGHPHSDFVNDYYTLRSRRSILNGFVEQAGGDGRLRGDIIDTGAASFRQTHKIIANIPGAYSKYGKEIRSLFVCPEEKKIVSGDGAGYQIRILAHYLKSPEYIDTVLNGDAHARHAEYVGCDRQTAKGVFFSVIFGAGGNKVGNIMGKSAAEGKKARDKLLAGIPGMNNLIAKLKNHYNKHGYIPGIDGRRVYPESDHKALNYLIQSTEAILMKQTWVDICHAMRDEGIEYKLLLTMHDELSVEVNESDAERVKEIMEYWFAESPRKYGVEIMECGDCKIGNSWYEVH